MTVVVDEDLLDDPAALAAADPADMLRVVASSPAQVREATTLAEETDLERLTDGGRPRALVVVGIGGSAIAGDVLAAVAGTGCPVPVITHRGYGLPGWVGATDVVFSVSCSGTTEETLTATDEAIRRGCRLLAVAAPDSPLAERASQARAPFIAVPGDRQPRASIWALSTPLVIAARALGLLAAPPAVLEAVASRLEAVVRRCHPSSDAFVNPAKALAINLAGTLPLLWGTSALAGVAAHRFATQLAENAKSLAVSGVLPEANHNQVVAFDGPYGALADAGSPSSRLVLLRDLDEHSRVVARVEATEQLAAERGIGVRTIVAEGTSPFERIASLVGAADYVSVYLALLLGIDPTPIRPIDEIKKRIAE